MLLGLLLLDAAVLWACVCWCLSVRLSVFGLVRGCCIRLLCLQVNRMFRVQLTRGRGEGGRRSEKYL